MEDTMFEKIEKLIVDGQKDLIERMTKVEEKMGSLEVNLSNKIDQVDQRLGRKIDQFDKKHDTNAKALYGLLQDTKQELSEKIDRVEKKLDQHMLQPA